MTFSSCMSCPMNKQSHNADMLWQLPFSQHHQQADPIHRFGVIPPNAPEHHHQHQQQHHHITRQDGRGAFHDITNAVLGKTIVPPRRSNATNNLMPLPRRQREQQQQEEEIIDDRDDTETINRVGSHSEDRAMDIDHV